MNRRKELSKLARRSLDALINLVLGLEAQVRELRRQIKELSQSFGAVGTNPRR